MANWRDALRGAAGGAGVGVGLSATGVGAPLGIPLALIGGVGGFFSGLFGESEEDIRKQRIETLLKSIEENRTKRLAEGTKQISTYTKGLRQNEFARAERAALASGREGEARTLSLPGTAMIAREGNRATERFITDTNRIFDAAKYDVQRDIASEPIAPNAVDFIESAGLIGSQFASMKGVQKPGETQLRQDETFNFQETLKDDINKELMSEFEGDQDYWKGFRKKLDPLGTSQNSWASGLRRRNPVYAPYSVEQ